MYWKITGRQRLKFFVQNDLDTYENEFIPNFNYRTAMKRAIIDYILLDYSERVRVNVLEIPTRFKPSVIRAPVPWRNNYLISKQFCRHNLFTTHNIIQRVSHTF